jgi:hypothetical protein
MPAAHLTVKGLLRVAGALVLSVSLAACTSDTGAGSPATSLSAEPNGVSGSGRPDPSSSAAPGTSSIPAGALLQGSDVRNAKPEPMESGDRGHLRPLRPCGDNEAYPSDNSRTAAVAVSYFLEGDATGTAPAVVVEFVGRHAAGGAAAQFDEITEALRRCPGSLGEKKRRWTVLDTDVAGDESVLVRIEERFSYGDEKPKAVSDYAAVARTGDLIVVVTDTGWENIDSSEKFVRDLIGKAVQRAGAAG